MGAMRGIKPSGDEPAKQETLEEIRIGILHILASRTGKYTREVLNENWCIELSEKLKRDEQFQPLCIVDLDTEKSKLVTGSKEIYDVYFVLSEHATDKWREYFNEAYFDEKTRRSWQTIANCDGQYIFAQEHERKLAKLKETLDSYVKAINDKCLEEWKRKRQVRWDAENRKRLEQETLHNLRDSLFKRKPKRKR